MKFPKSFFSLSENENITPPPSVLFEPKKPRAIPISSILRHYYIVLVSPRHKSSASIDQFATLPLAVPYPLLNTYYYIYHLSCTIARMRIREVVSLPHRDTPCIRDTEISAPSGIHITLPDPRARVKRESDRVAMRQRLLVILVFVSCCCCCCCYSQDVNGQLEKQETVVGLQTCIDGFVVHRDKIIRTQDSRDMGAKYLTEFDVESRIECMKWCCETEHCDVFIFEEKVSCCFCVCVCIYRYITVGEVVFVFVFFFRMLSLTMVSCYYVRFSWCCCFCAKEE